MFRRSATNLQGAALRVHITRTSDCVSRNAPTVYDNQVDSDNQGEHLSEELEGEDRVPSHSAPEQSFTQSMHQEELPTQDVTSSKQPEMSVDASFPVTIAVDRAMHLNLKGEPVT